MGSKRRGARMVCERPAAAEAGIQTAASPASTAAQATTGTAASGVAQLSAWRLSAWRLSALVRGVLPPPAAGSSMPSATSCSSASYR